MDNAINKNIFLICCCICIFFSALTGVAQPQIGENTDPVGQKEESASEPSVPGDSGRYSAPGKGAEQEENVQMSDIHDIKPPEEIGVDLTILYYLIGALTILAIAMAIFFFLKKRGKRLKEKKIIRLSPDEAAYNMLDDLMRDMEATDGKAFYFRLSAILRTYIKGRYNINAPDMTTEELGPNIEQLEIDNVLKKDLKILIYSVEPIKFAGAYAVADKMEKDLLFVRRFIKKTTEVSGQE